MSLVPPLGVRPASHVIATTNGQFIRLELADDDGPVAHGVTVGAGKRLIFSETRADSGLELLHVHRTGAWQQGENHWRAPVEADPA